MSPVRFAEYADLVRHLGLTPDLASTQLDVEGATLALSNASAAIRDACKWSVTQETVTDLIEWPCTGVLFLPTLRLTALAVSVSGVAWLDRTDFWWTSTGKVTFLNRRGGWSGSLAAPVSVSYTHGWASPPPSLRQVCLEQAAGAVQNPQRLASVTVGNVTEVYQRSSVSSSAPSLVDDPRVAAYVLPVVG